MNITLTLSPQQAELFNQAIKDSYEHMYGTPEFEPSFSTEQCIAYHRAYNWHNTKMVFLNTGNLGDHNVIKTKARQKGTDSFSNMLVNSHKMPDFILSIEDRYGIHL